MGTWSRDHRWAVTKILFLCIFLLPRLRCDISMTASTANTPRMPRGEHPSDTPSPYESETTQVRSWSPRLGGNQGRGQLEVKDGDFLNTFWPIRHFYGKQSSTVLSVRVNVQLPPARRIRALYNKGEYRVTAIISPTKGKSKGWDRSHGQWTVFNC